MSSYLQILKILQQSPTQASLSPDSSEQEDPNFASLNLQLTPSIANRSIFSERESFIEYVPFKRKVIDYEERAYIQKVPHTRRINDHIQKIVVDTVPRQRIETDYFAVEHLRFYEKEVIPEKQIMYVPVLRTVKRTEFVPVEKKIVHYPKGVSFSMIENSGPITINQGSSRRYERTPSFSRTVFLADQITDERQVPTSKLAQSLTHQTQQKYSPINSYMHDSAKMEQSNLHQIAQFENRVQASILNSLSKAYQIQKPTRQLEKDVHGRRQSKSIKTYNVYGKPIVRLEGVKHYKPSTLKQINYKSTETIDSRYLRNL